MMRRIREPSAKELAAYDKVVKNWKAFNTSNDLLPVVCRKMGLRYFQICAFLYKNKCRKDRIVNTIKAIPLIIDHLINRFNRWLLKL